MAPVRARVHSLQSGPSNCYSNSNQMQRSSSALRVNSAGSKIVKKQPAPDHEFCFAGNKKQYELNRDVVEKIDEALETTDAEERVTKLNEGKDLLVEQNKHILLAEKYGWDTVACYTAEPLATYSDDEKQIRKAIKESKQLRDEKTRSVVSKQKAKGGVPREPSERRVFIDLPVAAPPVAGKFSASSDGCSTCFRCFHFKAIPNSLPSKLTYERRDFNFDFTDEDCVNCINNIDNIDQNSIVKVKGRLRKSIDFWQSIGASQWLLKVLCEGYCLPFV